MEFSGDVDIRASREQVWAFLTDPHQVTQCAPGLKSVEVIDESHFNCVVRAGIGMIKGDFNFTIEWTKMDAPGHATMVANGKIPGSAVAMTSTMDLVATDDGAATAMHWASDVRISGTIAGVGARLMGGVADRMTKDIFSCIKSKLEASE